MDMSVVSIILGFIEGLGLIASPCILPILPIILSGSLDGSKKRPMGIMTGFIVTFALFTFFSRKLIDLIGIDASMLRNIAFGLLIVIGCIMLSSTLSLLFSRFTNRIANIGSSYSTPSSGFISGLVFGSLVAFVWTPCAGPILAAVIVQTVIQKSTVMSLLVLLAFGLGAGIPMFLIALFGRMIMERLTLIKNHAELLRKILGLIIIASVGFMIYDQNALGGTFTVSQVDENVHQTSLINGLSTPYPAPSLDSVAPWINSAPLTLSSLKGHVVLIDFWTYSCINCIRTLPIVKKWYEKYHAKGLDVIGVHTPEFDFEKMLDNVKRAVAKFSIPYPVTLDSQYVTWQHFNNQYWPAQYLINKQGEVVYQHFGEGEDDVMENNIRFLLGLTQVSNEATSPGNLADILTSQTPETYLGFSRAANNSNREQIKENQASEYSFPTTLSPNQWALQGKWIIHADNIESAGMNAAIKIHLQAKKVYVVMGSRKDKPIKITALFNDKPLNTSLTVTHHALYDVVAFDKITEGTLELIASEPGVEFYTFTFGS